jgi:hypothetical protein
VGRAHDLDGRGRDTEGRAVVGHMPLDVLLV